MEVIANIRIETGAVPEFFQTGTDGGVLAAGEEVDDSYLDEGGVVVIAKAELPESFLMRG